MRTNAPAPAPTYVDFVLAPAGLIGINTNSFGATRGETLRILKIPWMVPHPGDFFLNAQSCAGSKFRTYISNTRISLLQRQLRPRRIENRITNLSQKYKWEKVHSIDYVASAGALVLDWLDSDFEKHSAHGWNAFHVGIVLKLRRMQNGAGAGALMRYWLEWPNTTQYDE